MSLPVSGEFNISAAQLANLALLKLRHALDDGAVIYINGVPVTKDALRTKEVEEARVEMSLEKPEARAFMLRIALIPINLNCAQCIPRHFSPARIFHLKVVSLFFYDKISNLEIYSKKHKIGGIAKW